MSQSHHPEFRWSLLAPRFWPLWLVFGLYALLTALPARLRFAVGKLAAAALWRLPSRRRDIARINLELCFPDLPGKARETILRRHAAIVTHVFLNYGTLVFGSLPAFARTIEVHGREHFDRLQRERRNVIVLCPHVAALEHVGQWVVLNQRIVSVARLHQENPLLDWMVTRMRIRQGGVLFSNQASMVPLVKAVRGGAWMYLLPDEDPGEPGLPFAPFYGVPKATVPTLGRLAAACRAVVLPMAGGYAEDRGRFWIRFLSPVDVEPAADPAEDAARVNALLERIIDVDPAQYMWSAKIFRTRPQGSANPY